MKKVSNMARGRMSAKWKKMLTREKTVTATAFEFGKTIEMEHKIENITSDIARQKNECQGQRTSWRNTKEIPMRLTYTDTLAHSYVCMCLYCVCTNVVTASFQPFRH